jgi:sarcosine oxidase subunit gamma
MPDTAARRVPAIASNANWLEILPPATRFSFFGDAAAQAAIEPPWGPACSTRACRASVRGARATLWQGPDEYLLLDLAPAQAEAEAFEGLERALADLPHSLVDISHRQFGLRVKGPHAATILSGACPLDLDPREFPVDMCTRTVLAKADIVLWRVAGDVFHLEVWRSFAGYVTGVLNEIASEF